MQLAHSLERVPAEEWGLPGPGVCPRFLVLRRITFYDDFPRTIPPAGKPRPARKVIPESPIPFPAVSPGGVRFAHAIKAPSAGQRR
jgi:hypothetical protein